MDRIQNFFLILRFSVNWRLSWDRDVIILRLLCSVIDLMLELKTNRTRLFIPNALERPSQCGIICEGKYSVYFINGILHIKAQIKC